ncbi:ABC-2 type transport system ATP-binding protein [Natronoarchaeum philippinense]|uniref:ABC-2 type transport system ATP-binding protein n=1 Tax=Natronoarchaeum philippinense TaxID=558529 RepID=A0A285P1I9_NATPI|nr:ABC transporter ATP-binding protein [Natronoarchaeum philippinense]SNZ15023.1 ABC-2 type transport system ATP-binding protein [Natronoarchaeum philippinense]
MAAIELDGVTKRYGAVTALSGLDLAVEEGEIFGFLGPNGAGKSTTINVLLDFARPTEGVARVFGRDCQAEPVAVRERVGVLPDGLSVWDRLTGRQHVAFACESRESDADPGAILERVGLADAADRPAGDYSKGMAQRLALGMALVGEPDLLILDEPTTGLDPNGARRLREVLREERDRGATIFFSSHDLGQVEAICDRVAILHGGELVAEDTVEGLGDAAGRGARLRVTVDRADDDAVTAVESVDGVAAVDRDGDALVVRCDADAKQAVIRTLEDHGVAVADFRTEEASLEALFRQYTEGEA